MNPSRIDTSMRQRAVRSRSPLSLLLASAMVLLAITLRHASTGPDRFVLVMAIVLAFAHAGIGYRCWRATHAPRNR